jgi:sigma-B regulation protein RsbU (phosphoserine phosphatase)
MDATAKFELSGNNSLFIEEIINGMYDWVRVLDREDHVLFMNRSMAEAVGKNAIGMKCYEAIGRDKPCENCTTRRTVFGGHSSAKEENINGRIYSVMSSPVRDKEGTIVAVVEVLRDITETRRLQDSIVRQNRSLRNEIDMARKIQYSMLPKETENENIRFSYVYRPCETLGGDYLDFFKIDDTHYAMLVADVQGHGVPASLLTVFVMSALDRQTLSPAEALEKFYIDYNKNNFDSNLYITVFYSIIDIENMTVTYSNAGHSGSPVVFGRNRFSMLRSPGIPISNWTDKPGYINKSAHLDSGESIFYYTDGIMELRNEKGEQYDEDKLLGILLGGGGDSKELLETIMSDAENFAGKHKISRCDDITMAIVDMK